MSTTLDNASAEHLHEEIEGDRGIEGISQKDTIKPALQPQSTKPALLCRTGSKKRVRSTTPEDEILSTPSRPKHAKHSDHSHAATNYAEHLLNKAAKDVQITSGQEQKSHENDSAVPLAQIPQAHSEDANGMNETAPAITNEISSRTATCPSYSDNPGTDRLLGIRELRRIKRGLPPDLRAREEQLAELQRKLRVNCEHNNFIYEEKTQQDPEYCRICDYPGWKYILRCENCRFTACRDCYNFFGWNGGEAPWDEHYYAETDDEDDDDSFSEDESI